MANHKSSLKRIRQSEKRRVENKYYAVTARNAMRKLRTIENKEEAEKNLPNVVSMIDKLAKKNIIHRHKASNLKSKLQKHVSSL